MTSVQEYNKDTVELHEEVLRPDEVDSKSLNDGQAPWPVSAYASLSPLAVSRTFWKTWMFAGMAAFGATFDGYAVSIPGSIIANAGFVQAYATTTSATGELVLDAKHVGAWGGSQSGGQIVGMLVAPFISDRFGRRLSMLVLSTVLIIGVVLELVSTDWRVYLAARIFAGIGTGFVQASITVYISEIAPAQIRGAMMSMYSLFFALGQFTAAIALKVVNELPPAQFRHGFYSQFVFVGIFVPIIWYLPESPWFHTRRHQDQKAKQSMMKLYGYAQDYNIDTEFAVLHYNVAASETLRAQQNSSTYTEMFRGSNGRRTFISFFPLVFQQALGIPLIFGYASYFFSLAGVEDPFLATLVVNLVLIACIILSFYTVERVGRRPSLLVGAGVMGTCTLVVGILGAIKSENGNALVAMCAIWVAAYALSAGPIGWTFVAETSTPRLRAKTTGLAAAGTAAVGLIFNYTVPIMLDVNGANWGNKIGFLWAGLTVLGSVVVFFLIPETKGRSYSELDQLFERGISARRFGTTQIAQESTSGNGV